MIRFVKLILLTVATSQIYCDGVDVQSIVELLTKLKVQCLIKTSSIQAPPDAIICSAEYDPYWYCWPPTAANTTVTATCSKYFFQEVATERKCLPNGTWEDIKTVVKDTCPRLSFEEFKERKNDLFLNNQVITQEDVNNENLEIQMLLIEKQISEYNRYVDIVICLLTGLAVAWLIPMKNKRFILHRFLILGILLNDLFYILVFFTSRHNMKTCSYISVVGNYFFLVVIFMMFSEGFYQFRQFYFVFVDNQRLWTYIVFSYGFSAIIAFGIYLPLMQFDPPISNHLVCWGLLSDYKYEYVIFGPTILLLVLNVFITIYLMQLIITKLRNEKTSYIYRLRKSTRSLIILLCLMGAGYLITFYGPRRHWFAVARAFVKSSQGTLICLVQIWSSDHMIKALKAKFKHLFGVRMQLSREEKSKRNKLPSTASTSCSSEHKKESLSSTINIFKKWRRSGNSCNSTSSEDCKDDQINVTNFNKNKRGSNDSTNTVFTDNFAFYEKEIAIGQTLNTEHAMEPKDCEIKKSNRGVFNLAFVEDEMIPTPACVVQYNENVQCHYDDDDDENGN